MSQPLVSSANGAGLTGAVSAAAPSGSHQQLPTPSPASGLLDRLSAELAGVVVPSTTWLGVPSSAPVWPVADLALITAGLLGALFVQTYGLWLRRAGYVTAARSDVMTVGRSMFVVPQGLGMTRV